MFSNCFDMLKKVTMKRLTDRRDIELIIKIIFEVRNNRTCFLESIFRE